jgi:hypothetical protein
MDPERRRTLLETCSRLLRELELEGSGDAGEAGAAIARRIDLAGRRYAELCAEYRRSLPLVPLGRCPWCLEVVQYSLDVDGLDGLWWKHDYPVRGDANPVCAHYLALAGAVRLAAHVVSVPWLVKPGPEVPFVVPRLLSDQPVRAVVSSVRIGEHTGYPILYFAKARPSRVKLVNTWGSDEYEWVSSEGEVLVGHAYDRESDYDFELAPWISAGQLWWIAPGDHSWTPRPEVECCPYLGLAGRRRPLRIQNGAVW